MEKSQEFRCPLYMAFIDVRKAYDLVNRNALWYILQHEYSIPERLVKIIEALHSDTRASGRAYGKNSLEYAVQTGVRQRCVMAPVLFNIFFDVITKLHYRTTSRRASLYCTTLSKKKIVGGWKKFTDELLLNNMAYANDMVFLADSKSDLEEMLRSFDSTCSSMGLLSAQQRPRCWPSFHLDRKSLLSRLYSILEKVMS